MIDRRLKPKTASSPTTVTPVSSGPRWWIRSSASAIASPWAAARPFALTKVSSPHMSAILSRGTVDGARSCSGPGEDDHGRRHPGARSGVPAAAAGVHALRLAGQAAGSLDACGGGQLRQAAGPAVSRVSRRNTDCRDRARENAGERHDVLLPARQRPRVADRRARPRRGSGRQAGRRHTLAEKATELGIETAPLADLPAALDDCAPGRTRVLRGLDPTVDAAVRGNPEREGELATTLAEMRLVKDEWEIAQLVRAVDATVLGFEDVARVLPADRPVPERLLEGVFALRARHDGHGVGYGSIVGAGSHATTLHWTRNDGHTRPGELLLMDMGVESERLYTADVTRTLPVSGSFTPLQRDLYDLVLRAQQAGIDALTPGVPFDEVNQACMRVLAGGGPCRSRARRCDRPPGAAGPRRRCRCAGRGPGRYSGRDRW